MFMNVRGTYWNMAYVLQSECRLSALLCVWMQCMQCIAVAMRVFDMRSAITICFSIPSAAGGRASGIERERGSQAGVPYIYLHLSGHRIGRIRWRAATAVTIHTLYTVNIGPDKQQLVRRKHTRFPMALRGKTSRQYFFQTRQNNICIQGKGIPNSIVSWCSIKNSPDHPWSSDRGIFPPFSQTNTADRWLLNHDGGGDHHPNFIISIIMVIWATDKCDTQSTCWAGWNRICPSCQKGRSFCSLDLRLFNGRVQQRWH